MNRAATSARSLRRSAWRAVAAAAVSLMALAVAGCDSSNPVAPPAGGTPPPGGGGSTSFNVVLSANPGQVEAGSTEPVTITVTATRADGQPAPNGTSAALNTDLGQLATSATAEPATLVTVTLTNGRAQLRFLPGEDIGTANVLAQVGSSVGRLRVAVVEAIPESFFVSAVVPATGDPEGGELVTVQGEGFASPLLVAFASAQASVVSVRPTEIVVTTPPSVTEVQAGMTLLVDVTVTKNLNTPDVVSASLPGAFTYVVETLPPVFITGLAPSSGPAAGGTAVTISGGGFRAPLRVDFGGAVATVQSISGSQLSVVTPASPQPVAQGGSLAVAVTVANALDDGTQAPITLANAFTYLGTDPPPGSTISVTSATPASGSYLGGTLVTVRGSGFVSPVAVDLGGVRQRSETVVDSTTVQFTTAGVVPAECPAGGQIAATGLTVTNQSTSAQGSLATFVFSYQVPLPRITRISPTLGPQGGNTLVNVDGSGFEAPVRVVFTDGTNELAAAVTATSATRVQVSAPRVPDTFFTEVDCTTGDNAAGKRYVDKQVSVVLTNQGSGCGDTFPNAYTYRPTDTSCRPLPAPAS